MQEFIQTALLPQNLLFYFFAYALSATPTAYLVTRFVHKIDVKKTPLRQHTASYVWGNISKKSGFLVFVLDMLKGIIPCSIAYSLKTPPEIIALIGLVAVIGHCFSIWLNFFGGRGAATAAGAMLFVYWPASIFGVLFFLLMLFLGFGGAHASVIGVVIGIGIIFLGVPSKIIWIIALLMGLIIIWRYWAYK